MGHTKAKILYVDDHQDMRLLILFMLERVGYGVMTASSMEEGLALASQIEFDLFILDMDLPDGTGVEMCQRLKEKTPNAPVIYYTGFPFSGEEQEALAQCGDIYLTKPVSMEDFQEAVERALALKANQFQPQTRKEEVERRGPDRRVGDRRRAQNTSEASGAP